MLTFHPHLFLCAAEGKSLLQAKLLNISKKGFPVLHPNTNISILFLVKEPEIEVQRDFCMIDSFCCRVVIEKSPLSAVFNSCGGRGGGFCTEAVCF